jgi:hypothetical protein
MRRLKTLTLALLAATAAPIAVAQFSGNVPAVVPSVAGWEKIAGELELERPRRAVQYEFYVNPQRRAVYEVVRYRVTERGPFREDQPRPIASEKLQWDRDGRDLRRFECVAEGAGCAWHEMAKGGPDYLREVPTLMSLYNAHNRSTKRTPG